MTVNDMADSEIQDVHDDENDKVGHMEDEARKRRERIEKLKQAVREEVDHQQSASTEIKLPTPVFRNYQPSDEALKQLRLSKEMPTSLEEELSQQVDHDGDEGMDPDTLDEVGLENLAPKKVDWDLKRIIEKPLQRLERRTQRAIAELIRERMQTEVRQDDSKEQEKD